MGHVNVDRVVKDRVKELASVDAAKKPIDSTWILAPIDCVRIEAASLAWQHLARFKLVCLCVCVCWLLQLDEAITG